MDKGKRVPDPYSALADQIFDELRAVSGGLRSVHLDRELTAADVHDAVILATDEPGSIEDEAAKLISKAWLIPELEAALRDLVEDGSKDLGVGEYLRGKARRVLAKLKECS